MALPSVPPIEDDKLWKLFLRGEELGLRMEATDAGIVWETMPGLRHQELAVAIYGAILPGASGKECECYRALDIYIRFPSGIVKRPDISIFCRRPTDDEGFVHSIPEAVIEITSPESESKDLISGPPLYLKNGVKDVVVVHRSEGLVVHSTVSSSNTHASPVTITLACGCVVTL
jgi:Uma2 family endonuclease